MLFCFRKATQGIAPALLNAQRISRHCCKIALAKDSPGIFLIYNSSLCLKGKKIVRFPFESGNSLWSRSRERTLLDKTEEPFTWLLSKEYQGQVFAVICTSQELYGVSYSCVHACTHNTC